MDEETELLRDCLDQQRHHVLGILDGLSDEQLRRPVLPSGWTCLGMVKHLALADEHYWFRSVVGGESFGSARSRARRRPPVAWPATARRAHP
jgi:uncharacterized protein DUF664